MILRYVAIALLGLFTAAGCASAAGMFTNRHLLAFHACPMAQASNPENHYTYVAGSDNGLNWQVPTNYTAFKGSVPDLIRRGNIIYIYNPGTLHKYDTGAGDWSFTNVTIQHPGGEEEFWVDPGVILDDQGRIVLFYLVGNTNGYDPAGLPPGATNATKIFRSATEVYGSDGSRFIVDDGDRAQVEISTGLTCSDPDIVYTPGKYLMLAAFCNSIKAMQCESLRGSYSNVPGLVGEGMLVLNVSIPSGHYVPATGKYWVFGGNMVESRYALFRGVTNSFQQTMNVMDFTIAFDPTNYAGFGSNYLTASPGLADNSFEPWYYTNNLAAVDAAASRGASTGYVTVSWAALTNAAAYTVLRSESDDTNTAAIAGTTTNNVFNDTSAVRGKIYYYWVQPVDCFHSGPIGASDVGWIRSPLQAVQNCDFDGDRLADPSCYYEGNGTWRFKFSGSQYGQLALAEWLGGPSHLNASGDYDGDGRADPAVYCESCSGWNVRLSTAGYNEFHFTGLLGGTGWRPCPADYDGDAKADPAVYADTNAAWKVLLSGAGYYSVELSRFAGGPAYMPVSADYDGDAKADPAAYSRIDGTWAFRLSSAGYAEIVLAGFLGGAACEPAAADYDGDRLADPAVWDVTTGDLILKLSSSGYVVLTLSDFFPLADYE